VLRQTVRASSAVSHTGDTLFGYTLVEVDNTP